MLGVRRETIVYAASGWSFEWSGGPYIDVRRPGTVTAPDGWEVSPPTVDAVNVYDYASGTVTITTSDDVVAAAQEWLADYAKDYEDQGY